MFRTNMSPPPSGSKSMARKIIIKSASSNVLLHTGFLIGQHYNPVCLLLASYWFLAWLTSQASRWMHIPPKLQPTSNGLYGVVCKKSELWMRLGLPARISYEIYVAFYQTTRRYVPFSIVTNVTTLKTSNPVREYFFQIK
jgi:hypothetical protein